MRFQRRFRLLCTGGRVKFLAVLLLIILILTNFIRYKSFKNIKILSKKEKETHAKAIAKQTFSDDQLAKTGISRLFENDRQHFNGIVLTENSLREYLYRHCGEENEAMHIQLEKYPDVVLPLAEYKKQLAYNFTKKYSQSFRKRNVSSTLTPNLEEALVPSNGLVDHEMEINAHEIRQELEQKKRQRVHDDDVLKIPEVAKELNTSKMKIPNIVHFIWFGNSHEFLIQNYIAIVSAWRYQKPAAILFHHDYEPVSEYWIATKKKCGNVLKLVKRTPPSSVYGNKIDAVEHKSDVARLQILMEVGGIYLDTDSVILKSVDTFRNHEMVIGQPHRLYALENAIMFANRNSWFLARWYHEYSHYRSKSWDFNSLVVPGSIAYYYPNSVFLTFKELCRPHWKEVKMIYNIIAFEWEPIYVMHLFQRSMAHYDGTPQRPLKELAVLNSTYGQVARHVIWGDKKIRNVTDWIVTCDLEKFLEI